MLILGKHSYLQKDPARYAELGAHPYLETLTLFVSPPTAVSLGGRRMHKKEKGLGFRAPNLIFFG